MPKKLAELVFDPILLTSRPILFLFYMVTEMFSECLLCARYYAKYFHMLPPWLFRCHVEMSLHESLRSIHRVNFLGHLGKAILYGTVVLLLPGFGRITQGTVSGAGDARPDSRISSAASTTPRGTDIVCLEQMLLPAVRQAYSP